MSCLISNIVISPVGVGDPTSVNTALCPHIPAVYGYFHKMAAAMTASIRSQCDIYNFYAVPVIACIGARRMTFQSKRVEAMLPAIDVVG